MAQEIINIGTTPNDGTGDTLRNSFQKTNSNFTELYSDKENVSNKATNLTSPDNIKYPTTLAVSTALSGKQDTLTNPITGTGTTNYVSKFTGASTLGNSLIFDNGTNVYIGTTSPAAPARFGVVSTNFTAIRADASSGFTAIQIGGNGRFSVDAVGNAGGRFFIGDTGFVGIGNGSPGARLDIRAQGALSTDIAFRVRNSANDNDLIRVQGNGNVGIATTAPTSRLHVVGLPAYADNAAALAGGLTVGAFYHTGGILKVVI